MDSFCGTLLLDRETGRLEVGQRCCSRDSNFSPTTSFTLLYLLRMSHESRYASPSSSTSTNQSIPAKKPDLPTWTSSRVAKLKQQQQQQSGKLSSTSSTSSSSTSSKWENPPNIPRNLPISSQPTKSIRSSSPPRSNLNQNVHPQSNMTPSNSTSSIISSSPFKRNSSKPLGGGLNPMELLASPSRGLNVLGGMEGRLGEQVRE